MNIDTKILNKILAYWIQQSVQFSRSVMSNSLRPHGLQPRFPVHHQLPEFTQTHVHWLGDAIQPSHPLLSPSPPAFSLSQHQGLFTESVLLLSWKTDNFFTVFWLLFWEFLFPFFIWKHQVFMDAVFFLVRECIVLWCSLLFPMLSVSFKFLCYFSLVRCYRLIVND